MSDIIVTNENGVEQLPEPTEFYVFAGEDGFHEIRLTKDVDFILRTYVGLGEFISRHLNPPVGLATLLRQLADVVDATERMKAERQAQAANDGGTNPPEAA
jgi:hypothetical protein